MNKTILGLAGLFWLVSSTVHAADLPTRNISGGVYLGLSTFSRQNNLHYAWDPLLKNATITGSTGMLKFHVGSAYALHRDSMVDLKSKTRFLDGEVWAPYVAKNFLDPLAATRVTSAPPNHRVGRVVIDPGHGGRDFGAMGLSGIREKDLVLEISKKLQKELRSRGVDAVLTRQEDVFLTLNERARIANNDSTSFFVSVHANASTTKSLKGFEIYTLSEATGDATLATQRAENSVLRYETARPEQETDELKAIFWDLKEAENRKESLRLSHFMMDSVQDSLDTAARRQRTANFYVLKWTECPAALIEIGYITNVQDARRLRSPIYRGALVQAIASGIMRYKEEFEKTDGYTQ